MINRYKIKLFVSYAIALFLLLFCLLPVGFIYGEDGNVPDNIIVKEIDSAGFPNISVYLNFKEDSQLGLTDLNEENFEITENGNIISSFEVKKVGEISEPTGIALVLDTSGSMKGEPIENLKAAASVFIDKMRDIDKIAIIGFADKAVVFSGFTSDNELLKSSIDSITPEGETALFDGIEEGLKLFENTEGLRHKYLVVLSDGADTVSTSTVGNIVERANTGNITVYSVALLSSEFNPEDLDRISAGTNGELLQTTDPAELTETYSDISGKIRNQYKLTYKSLSPNTESFKTAITISNMGIVESTEVSYENPFFTFSGSTVTSSSQASQSLAKAMIFDKWWIKLIIFLLIFISVTMFLYVGSTIMVPNKGDLKTRTDLYLRHISSSQGIVESSEQKVRPGFFNRLSILTSRKPSKNGFAVLFEEKLKRAGINMSGSKFIFMHIVSVVVVTIAIFVLTKNLLLTVAVVLIIIFLPFLFINFKVSAKIKKFNEQLPDTLQLVEGALKAGYSLNQSLSMVINETKPPISEEFKITLNEIRMGQSEKNALENMAKRINSELFNWVVLAINIQRDVGGNLAEIMDIIASTIRDKEKVMRQIKSLTAEGKLSAYILIGLPIIVGIALSVLNRSYINVLFTTKIGFMLLFLAGLLMLVGIVWIMRIIKIDY